ncbi:hypothetical protein FSARC_7556 [Fusarium sarcochroum]|uniref:Uncharacterized protein n=1 Tax=Fusarium sarcochroum TaxID=1208366 RepID=A0A8H4TV23_9HYPO|nr:hypothetical protein FSARC_7556 [Fusarium sarcochroum]
MSDTGWLRFLGANKHRPQGLKSPRSEAALQDLVKDTPGSREAHTHHKGKSMTRLSSWQGAPQTGQGTASAPDLDSSLDEVDRMFINAGQQVWHSPSVDQVAEALRVAAMTNPANEPLPAEYRPHILFVCEAYGTHHHKIARLETQLAEAKDALKQEVDRHSIIEERWSIQDARYKAEVKRLELFIHDMSGKSMEAVTLARAGSLIRGRPKVTRGEQAATEGNMVDERASRESEWSCMVMRRSIQLIRAASETAVPDDNAQMALHAAFPTRQGTVLSRTRTINTSNEIRLSTHFRNFDSKKSRKSNETRRLEAQKVDCGKTHSENGRTKQRSPSASVPSIGSNSRGTANKPPHEGNVERKRDSTDKAAAPQEVGDDQLNSTSTAQPQKQDTTAECKHELQSQRQHRRQFSFVPGDDRTAVQLAGTLASRNAPVAPVAPENDEQAPSVGRQTNRSLGDSRRSRSAEWIRTGDRSRPDTDDTFGATDSR